LPRRASLGDPEGSKLFPLFYLNQEFVRLDHGFMGVEHGFQDPFSQLEVLCVTTKPTKRSKLAHKATISCVEVSVSLGCRLPLFKSRFQPHWSLHGGFPRYLDNAGIEFRISRSTHFLFHAGWHYDGRGLVVG